MIQHEMTQPKGQMIENTPLTSQPSYSTLAACCCYYSKPQHRCTITG